MSRPIQPPRIVADTNGIFQILWTENGKSRRKSTGAFDTEAAGKVFGEWLLEREQKAIVNVNSLLDFYYFNHVQEQCLDITRIENCFKPLRIEFGEMLPRQINAESIFNYKRRRKKGFTTDRKVGDSTIRRELITLVAALNFAAENKLLKKDEIPNVVLPPVAPPKDFWLSESEVKQYENLASNFNRGRLSRVYRFVILALETAARKESILSLEWHQVDFNAGVINFQKNMRRQKNKKRVCIPISDLLMKVLKQAYSEKTTEFVLDTPYSIQYAIKQLNKSAVIAIGEKVLQVTPHTLRHTAATLMARANVPLRVIAGMLGDTQATVDRVYAHHSPDHLRAGVNYRA